MTLLAKLTLSDAHLIGFHRHVSACLCLQSLHLFLASINAVNLGEGESFRILGEFEARIPSALTASTSLTLELATHCMNLDWVTAYDGSPIVFAVS